MDPSGDDLAGVVDLFGALTREELGNAFTELAFKQGEEVEPDSFSAEIDAAIEEYQLLRLDAETVGVNTGKPVLVVGPSAFPAVPEAGEDLRHILDIEERNVEREVAGEAAAQRLRSEVDALLDADQDDHDAVESLIDVSYDIEAWAPVDLTGVRSQLDSSE